MEKWLSIFLFVTILLFYQLLHPTYINAGRGCCSWHGGQSYCDTNVGRWVCNDGTYSPSCTCTYIPPKPTNTPTPLPTYTPTPKPTNSPTPTFTPTPKPSSSETPSPIPEVKGSTNEDNSTPITGMSIIGGSLALGLFGFRKLFRKTN